MMINSDYIGFKKRVIIICFLSALFVPINIFAERSRLLIYNAVQCEDKIIIECPKPFLMGDEDINREVPLYKFTDTIKGQFLERFCDSLSNVSATMNSIEIMPLNIKGLQEEERLKYEAIYLQTTLINGHDIDKAKGVLLTTDNNICLLDGITPLILEEADVVIKTKYYAELRYSDEFLPEELKNVILHLDEFQMASASLLIEPTGKIDVVNFYINYNKFQDDKNVKYHKLFDWIDSFYQTHDFTPGCLYMNQPEHKDFMYSK